MLSDRYAADPDPAHEDDMRASARALLVTLLVGALTILGLLYGSQWIVGVVQRGMF